LDISIITLVPYADTLSLHLTLTSIQQKKKKMKWTNRP
jgi:hypothetical protein